MNQPRRLWPVVTAVLIGLPVFYVLSVGVLEWVDQQGYIRGEFANRMYRGYVAPARFAAMNGPQPVRHAILKYSGFMRNLTD